MTKKVPNLLLYTGKPKKGFSNFKLENKILEENSWIFKKAIHNDTYAEIMKYLENPFQIWIITDKCRTNEYGIYHINDNTTLYLLPYLTKGLPLQFNKVFVRADHLYYNSILKKIVFNKLIYYGANVNRIQPLNLNFPLDTILSDTILPTANSYLIEKPVNHKIFCPIPNEAKIFDFCFIGNWAKHKGYDILLNILPLLNNLNILILGERFTNKIKNLIRSKTSSNIYLPGFVDRTKVGILLNRSKFLLITSTNDCYPRTINEAFACNVPVLAIEELKAGKRHINSLTGKLSSKKDLNKLVQDIYWMTSYYKKFNPKKYFDLNLSTSKLKSYYKGIL